MTAAGEPAASSAALSDGAALDRIAELLRDEANGGWGPCLPNAIGEIVRATGRDVGGPE